MHASNTHHTYIPKVSLIHELNEELEYGSTRTWRVIRNRVSMSSKCSLQSSLRDLSKSYNIKEGWVKLLVYQNMNDGTQM